MEDDKVEVRVTQLMVSEGQEQQFVLLREAHPPAGAKAREILMVIGMPEAAEIARCLRAETTERPLTHELAYRILTQLGGRLVEAVIRDLQHNVYFAELHVDHLGVPLRIDCRPSDALALSLRNRSRVYVRNQVFTLAVQES